MTKKTVFNIVELMADESDCAFDQPCIYGHRVESHAVYCHNDKWPDAPRKCGYGEDTWSGVPHSECPGFKVNPAQKQ